VACEQARHHGLSAEADDLGLHAKGRFGKQDFVYVAAGRCFIFVPLASRLTIAIPTKRTARHCVAIGPLPVRRARLKAECTTGKERRISRWEHEAILEAVQARLDRNPDKMRVRRQTVEHPFAR